MRNTLKSKLGLVTAGVGIGLLSLLGTPARAGQAVYDKGFEFLMQLASIQGDTTITQENIPNIKETVLPFGDLNYASRGGDEITVVSRTENGTYEKVSPYKIGWGPFKVAPGKMVCPAEVKATQYDWQIHQQLIVGGHTQSASIIDRKNYFGDISDIPEFVNGTTFVVDSTTQIKLKPRSIAKAIGEFFTDVPDSLVPTSFGFFEACGKKYGFLYLGTEYGNGIDYIWDLSEKNPPTSTKFPKDFPRIQYLGNVFRPDTKISQEMFEKKDGVYVLNLEQALF